MLIIEMALRSKVASQQHLALALRGTGFLGGERRRHSCMFSQGRIRNGLRGWGVAFRGATGGNVVRGSAEHAKHSVRSWLWCRRLLGTVRASLVRLDTFRTARTLLHRSPTWRSLALGLDGLLRLLFLSWLCHVVRRLNRRHSLLLSLVVLYLLANIFRLMSSCLCVRGCVLHGRCGHLCRWQDRTQDAWRLRRSVRHGHCVHRSLLLDGPGKIALVESLMHVRIASAVKLMHTLAGTGVCHLLSSWMSSVHQWQWRERSQTSLLTRDRELSEHCAFVSRRQECRESGFRRPFRDIKHSLGGQAIV